MEALLPDDDTSQEAIARARLQRDFLSAITSVIGKPKTLKRSIKRLDNYLRNPFLDINFEIDGISPLSKATSEWRVLDKLLQHEGIDLNICNPDGRTSLFSAIKCPQTDSLKLLISQGAVLDHRDNKGRTPLSLAAELGRLDHLEILVESNADINSTDSKSWTPLFWAVSRQHHETLKYLLSNQNVDIDHQDSNARTLLEIAVETRNIENIKCLIDAKAKDGQIIGIERDLLIWAIFQRDIETVQHFLKVDESLANHRVKGRTPLSMATELGDVGITRLLIDAKADVHALDEIRWPILSNWLFETYLPPDEILQQVDHFSANYQPTKQPPLLLAAEFRCVEILQLLLSVNANVNSTDAKGLTALAWAVEKRHDAAVKILLEIPGIYLDSRDLAGKTPLIMAATLGETNILNQLLNSNAAINSEDNEKCTSLSWAVANGHEQTVDLLLRISDVCVDHQDGRGRTPFSQAAERGFIRIMHLLIENGADPHVHDNEGHTGFWWFLRARHDLFISCSNCLVRPGLGGSVNPFILLHLICALRLPNKKDKSGRNWLSWAAEYGDDEIVRYFLQSENKVDINICDGTGDTFSRTPLIWALEGKHGAVMDLLKDGDTTSLHLLVEGISTIEKGKILDLVRTLLQAGYNVNQPDQKGRTPLHLACLKGSLELVSALIEAKTDLGFKDHNSEIPLQYALRKRNRAIVDLLLNASSTDLEPVRSKEWFDMEEKTPSWIQITRRIDGHGFKLEFVNDLECDWLPRAKEARLW
ncbi:hypothetical protein N7520_004026 [Penicillium odoratum]|uniref:uncharacterized protein n=1 Tax=Penicillium odoratum TaxID=1167516 RepID=UPI002547F45E|nr:uncharacterized protein N7520_004026 [Penicillium odoratum]KAJ5769467.1 hypothetical protein N7520_004026 [Penicillium odoratum]